MRVLSDDECMMLLGSVRLGRIGLTYRALPVVLPVGVVSLDGGLVFRVGPGVISRAAEMRQVVCFEADGASEGFAAAWSVTAIGQLTTLRDPTVVRRARQLDLVAWSETCETYLGLRPELLSGRRRET